MRFSNRFVAAALGAAACSLGASLERASAGPAHQTAVLGTRWVDVSGERHQIGKDGQSAGVAFVFLSTECPICQQYSPELNRLAEAARNLEIEFFGVVTDPVQNRADVAAFVREYDLRIPVLFDADAQLAEDLEPTHTPEAFLVDRAGQVVYRGRIDDLYPSPGKKRAAATSRDLLAAMESLAAGRAIEVPQTVPVGCRFGRPEARSAGSEVTFTRHIAPILYANCTECHRPGEVAPFPLVGYEDASKRADWLAEVVQTGLMPPWRAVEGYGHFIAERRLSPRQKQLLAEWADAGAPRGDDADMPALPNFPDGWLLGEPDLVLEAPHSVDVPAEGPDLFHHFVVPLNLPEDVDAVAIEFRPGNPRIVHHAITFLDPSGVGRKRDAETPEPGFTTKTGTALPLSGVLNIWAPGVTARPLPEGIGLKLPKSADVIVQLHLHPNGKVETDRSRVGIYFAKTPATRFVMDRPFIYGPITIDIPPGARDHRLSASMKLPVDLTLTAVLPHMHLLGREIKAWAELPDGGSRPLIWVKDWNFYWQDQYVYREPVRLPAGSVVHVEGRFDNSAENPLNPSTPPQRVLLGEESTDEMCLAIFQSVVDRPEDALKVRNTVVGGALRQLKAPGVTPELRAHTLSMLRQSAGAEFQGMFADQLKRLAAGGE
jgi:peroxiredoxin